MCCSMYHREVMGCLIALPWWNKAAIEPEYMYVLLHTYPSLLLSSPFVKASFLTRTGGGEGSLQRG